MYTTPPADPEVSSDIDSFLGFATSLAFARGGLNVDLALRVYRNITTDVYITSTAYREDPVPPREEDRDEDEGDPPRARTTTTLLRNIPHFFAGRLFNARDIEVYFLFPHLPVDGEFIGLKQ
ncbi:hypothetical protein AYO21_12102 [Fonsecaea monophora]|uniref:Uncharacterized protein n=1 Tax=Fonsecaea monophora TaxID=254056 RepID=A0A177ERU7_9EURO|nr:hypothetical protein AYO21_12102 [Fonsecaea monophora]OAG33802.1 hypothetical protein AYO21_12102 [Fonsecaea monophora]